MTLQGNTYIRHLDGEDRIITDPDQDLEGSKTSRSGTVEQCAPRIVFFWISLNLLIPNCRATHTFDSWTERIITDPDLEQCAPRMVFPLFP
jgi:hypothetical protein